MAPHTYENRPSCRVAAKVTCMAIMRAQAVSRRGPTKTGTQSSRGAVNSRNSVPRVMSSSRPCGHSRIRVARGRAM